MLRVLQKLLKRFLKCVVIACMDFVQARTPRPTALK